MVNRTNLLAIVIAVLLGVAWTIQMTIKDSAIRAIVLVALFVSVILLAKRIEGKDLFKR